MLLLPGLGRLDLWAPDEPRYAEVAEELRARPNGATDLVVLHLNGRVYTQKPPLYYWLAAAVGATRDHVDAWSARLPSAVAGVLVIALTMWLGGAMLGSARAGVIAAALLLTMPRFAHQARRAQLDVLLTLFEVVALAAYWRLQAGPDRPPGRRAGLLGVLHGAVGLALLTKGPVGALPWLVIAIHCLWEGRRRALRSLFPVWGIALALTPVLCWLGAVALIAPGGYFDDAVLDNVLARYFTGTDHVRPVTYYLTQLPADALPWSPVVIVGIVLAWRGRLGADALSARAARLLLVWGSVFFVFFSLSAGKRGVYMLPLFPALAILGALPLSRWIDAGRLPRSVAIGAASLLAAVSLVAGWAALGAPGGADGPTLALVPSGFLWSAIGIGLVGAAATLGPGLRVGAPTAGIASFAASVLALQLATFHWLFPALDGEKSPRPVAEAVSRVTKTHERVGVFRHSAFAGGLEYYSGRRVVVLESGDDVHAFLDRGGRIVVVRERDRSALPGGDDAEERARARSGRRRLLVLDLAPPNDTTEPVERSEATPRRGATTPPP